MMPCLRASSLQPRLVSEDQYLAEGCGKRVEATLRHWLKQLDIAKSGNKGYRPTLRAMLSGMFCVGLMAATNKHVPARFRIDTLSEFDQYVSA